MKCHSAYQPYVNETFMKLQRGSIMLFRSTGLTGLLGKSCHLCTLLHLNEYHFSNQMPNLVPEVFATLYNESISRNSLTGLLLIQLAAIR